MILVNGRKIDTTTEGYLVNPEDWSEDVAVYLSERDNIKLSDEHWRLISYMRRYYGEYGIVPNQRQLQKLLKDEFGEARPDIHVLFPHGNAAKRAARYAGTPKPTGCI